MKFVPLLLTSFICFYVSQPSALAMSRSSKDDVEDKQEYKQVQQPRYHYRQDQYGNFYYQPNNMPEYYGQYGMPGQYAPVAPAYPVQPMVPPMQAAAPMARGIASAGAPAPAPEMQNQQAKMYTPYVQEQKNYLPHSASTGSMTMNQKLNDVTAEEALTKLKHGNLRFVQGMSRSSKVSQGERMKLMAGQKPHSIVLTCSDSRVPPENVFDQKLGDLYVIRNAGPALDAATVASIEYAVTQLGTRLVLVMGHEGCAGLKAAIMTPPGKSTGSPAWDQVVADIQPRLGSLHRRPASVGFVRESNENTRGIVKDMISRSNLIRQRISNGHLQLRSGFYNMDSGLVDFH